MQNYLQQVFDYFRNLALNSAGAERTLYELIQDKDIARAIELMRNRDAEVDAALKEYNTQTHDIMSRPNKSRKNAQAYTTEKLPRARQRYINEVELFFLFGNPVKWRYIAGDKGCYELFTSFLKNQRFDSNMRKTKRLAGAETESAKLYHIFRDEDANKREVRTVILARSTGYRLRPLFDQYGKLVAFGYGYKLKENGRTVEHWDIQTPEILAYSKRTALGWQVETFKNPTGKINVLYYQQPKAWAGAEHRLNREEMLDSKVADTNNYFADPIATATGDVIDNLTDPNKPGKLIHLIGNDSKFEYVNPPQNSESRKEEHLSLEKSILFDTFTPDLSFENLKGFGTVSGSAIKNAMILGYIKRDNLKEIYDEMLSREKHVIISILKYLYPEKASSLDSLEIGYDFQEPFASDRQSEVDIIMKLYQAGLMSLEEAVTGLSLTDSPQDEIKRINKRVQPNSM